MSWSFDEVMAVLGDEAEVIASGVKVLATTVTEIDGVELVKRESILIGRFDGMSFILTDAGAAYLDGKQPAEPKPKRGLKKKAVEPQPEVDILEDLGLDD